MDGALQEARLRPALAAWWAPRLHRIADWVAGQESKRRDECPPARIVSEAKGMWQMGAPGWFALRGRADRIEQRPDGKLAILDYKTGSPPSQREVEAGFAPQLPLEAAMAASGAFGPELRGGAAELVYWHLTGGHNPGQARSLFKGDTDAIAAGVAEAEAKLRDLITSFDDPARPYLSQPHPGWRPRFARYVHLARVAEWDLAGGEG
jgi:ATP-dependent helicase/nuclease subunit B